MSALQPILTLRKRDISFADVMVWDTGQRLVLLALAKDKTGMWARHSLKLAIHRSRTETSGPSG